jgi:FKBP-type peptidyl-prolyl cis-trans isomerase
MTLPARRRGRISLLISAACAAALAGALAAQAQQPPAAGSAAAPATAPAASAGATPAKPAAKGEAAAPDEKSAESYSLGLQWGETLRNSGLTPESISSAKIAQGIRDAISGKVTVGDADRENVRKLATSAGESNHRAAAKFLAENGKKPGIVTTKSGLQYQEIRAGSGDSPKPTDSVTVNYRGTLLNGTEFDSSYKRGQAASFEVGHVIPGWTEALQLMKPGSKWKLFIPPQLAYDLRSRPPIPPGSMLIFDVELISAQPAAAPAAPPASANPPTGARPVPGAVPAAALPKATGKPPVNPSDTANSPPPASMPAPK